MAKFDKKKRTASKGGSKARGGTRSSRGDSNTSKSAETRGASALLQSAANISFPTSLGLPVDIREGLSDVEYSTGTGQERVMTEPGIIEFGFIPTPGKCSDWTSPFNVWLRDCFTFLRHANSGTAMYEAADLGNYFLQQASCYGYHAWMRRVIGLVNAAVMPGNAYTPKALVGACRVNYDDVIANLAQLRTYVNTYAVRLNALRVPALSFFRMHDYLLENVFRDSDMLKSSFYVFNPEGFWNYKLGTAPDNTGMELIKMGEHCSYQDIVNMGERLLNTLLNEQAFNIMSGDILKAYGEKTLSPAYTEVEYSVQPVYDVNLLFQIHNANVMAQSPTDAWYKMRYWMITQNADEGDPNAGCTLFAPTMNVNTIFPAAEAPDSDVRARWAATTISSIMKSIVDLPSDQPDAGSVATVSRFKLASHLVSKADEHNGQATLVFDHFGPEIITSMQMWQEPYNGPTMNREVMIQMTHFDFAPMLAGWRAEYNTVTSGNDTLVRPLLRGPYVYQGEAYNITAMSHEVLRNIFYAMFLGFFDLA